MAKKPNIFCAMPFTFTVALSLHLLKGIADSNYRNMKPENISLLEEHKGLITVNVSSSLPQKFTTAKVFLAPAQWLGTLSNSCHTVDGL